MLLFLYIRINHWIMFELEGDSLFSLRLWSLFCGMCAIHLSMCLDTCSSTCLLPLNHLKTNRPFFFLLHSFSWCPFLGSRGVAEPSSPPSPVCLFRFLLNIGQTWSLAFQPVAVLNAKDVVYYVWINWELKAFNELVLFENYQLKYSKLSSTCNYVIVISILCFHFNISL